MLLRPLEQFADFLQKKTLGLKARLERLTLEKKMRNTPRLLGLYETFMQSPEAKWSIAKNDAVKLYDLVSRHKPQNILELGTGIGLSTAIIALALSKNESGHVTSLEQSKKCVDVANNLIPEDLKKYIEVIHARPAIFRFKNVSKWLYFCGYDWLPPEGSLYDFVFIDGPAGWIEDGELVSLDAGDIFRILPFLNPGAKVYVDGRRTTVRKIERYLGNYLQVIERTSEFTIFERKKREISSPEEFQIQNTKLQEKETPYEELSSVQWEL